MAPTSELAKRSEAAASRPSKGVEARGGARGRKDKAAQGSDARTAQRELLAAIRRTLQERELLQGATHVLVACSGGPDSQVLLHTLGALRGEHGFRLSAASIDHGLRAEAAAEMAMARRLAESLFVPFFALRVEVPRGASRQAHARAARYEALAHCARDLGAQRIAVGHTQDDQAETVLARLLRGSGLEGLSAIAPLRGDGVVRPLIDCSRAAVRAYLAACDLEAADDPSNADERYLRTRVRHRLLPQLVQENPRLPAQLAHLADDAREAAQLLQGRVEGVLAQAGRRVQVLREQPGLVRRWALKTLVERELRAPLARAHVAALDRMLWGGGQVRVPGDVVVSIDGGGELALERVAKRGRGLKRRNH